MVPFPNTNFNLRQATEEHGSSLMLGISSTLPANKRSPGLPDYIPGGVQYKETSWPYEHLQESEGDKVMATLTVHLLPPVCSIIDVTFRAA